MLLMIMMLIFLVMTIWWMFGDKHDFVLVLIVMMTCWLYGCKYLIMQLLVNNINAGWLLCYCMWSWVVWMGRRRHWLVCLLIGELFEDSFEATSFSFEVFRVGLWFRGVCLFIFLYMLEILRLCIDDDMSCMMTWLLGDLFYYGWLLRCFLKLMMRCYYYSATMFLRNYLCMLNLFEDVTSKFLSDLY